MSKQVDVKIINVSGKEEDVELELKKTWELGYKQVGEFGKHLQHKILKRVVENGE